MAMAAMNMVSAGGFSRISFHLRKCPQGVASVLRKKTSIFGSRRSKLDPLTVSWACSEDKKRRNSRAVPILGREKTKDVQFPICDIFEILISLFRWPVHFYVEVEAFQRLVLVGLSMVVFGWLDCHTKQFYSPLKLEFVSVTGTETITSKGSPGSNIWPWEGEYEYFEKDGVTIYRLSPTPVHDSLENFPFRVFVSVVNSFSATWIKLEVILFVNCSPTWTIFTLEITPSSNVQNGVSTFKLTRVLVAVAVVVLAPLALLPRRFELVGPCNLSTKECAKKKECFTVLNQKESHKKSALKGLRSWKEERTVVGTVHVHGARTNSLLGSLDGVPTTSLGATHQPLTKKKNKQKNADKVLQFFYSSRHSFSQ